MNLLLDTTLRDGEQSPGAYFSLEEKSAIALRLLALGIQEIEVRSPVGDPVLQEQTRQLLHQVPARWLLWCRAHPADIETALACDARRLHLAYPTSDIQLSTLHTKWENALTVLKELCAEAVKRADFVSVGAQDASRTPVKRLIAYGEALASCGVKRLRLADTLGLMMPMQVASLVRTLKKALPGLELEFHAHNDLGMATANALTALTSGAHTASATVMGIGERAGNAALEQLVWALSHHYPDYSRHWRPEHIAGLCQSVAQALKTPIAPAQPLVGEYSRLHQSGIHVAGLLKDARSYQPFDPARLGCAPMKLELGPLSGRHALRHVLEEAGIALEDLSLEGVWEEARSLMREQKRALKEEELRQICHRFVS